MEQDKMSDIASENEDRPVNVVDALYAIAEAIERLGAAVNDVGDSIVHPKVGAALEGLASLKERGE